MERRWPSCNRINKRSRWVQGAWTHKCPLNANLSVSERLTRSEISVHPAKSLPVKLGVYHITLPPVWYLITQNRIDICLIHRARCWNSFPVALQISLLRQAWMLGGYWSASSFCQWGPSWVCEAHLTYPRHIFPLLLWKSLLGLRKEWRRYPFGNLWRKNVQVSDHRLSLHGGYSGEDMLEDQPCKSYNWMRHSGHLQTLYCVAGDFSKIDKVVYHRRVLINSPLSWQYWTSICAIENFFALWTVVHCSFSLSTLQKHEHDTINCRGLDFTPTNSDQLKPDTPLIVVMHGLTGGMSTFC